ncbi:MAG: Nif3-like dinuclear metal center hexameric protein [Brevinemataceae bacterium]
MVSRNELVSLLDNILLPQDFKDYTYNGLQFEGKEFVSHIACAVDISLEIIKKSASIEADFLITHHGIIWGGLKKICSIDKARLEILFRNNINVYCSHLPLDKHPIFGNNARIIQILNLHSTNESFYQVGYFAEYKNDVSYDTFIKIIKKEISEKLIIFPFGSKHIKRVAVCSGGAALNLESLLEAHQKGADTLLSGETNSVLYHYAQELNMNVICAGHYATEVFGVQAVLNEIQHTYQNQLKYSFIDIPTGF